MKKARKLLALILSLTVALTMGMAVGTTAFAAPTNTTISVPSSDTHNYYVYQIFTGDLADGVLSDVHWGANGTGNEGALVPKATLDAIEAIDGTDAEKAAALSAYADLTSNAKYSVNSGESVTVPTGYYLIKDKDAIGDNDEATLYILKVVGPTTISRKAGTTTSDKTTDDVNDSTGASQSGQDSSDYDIGDDVPYHVSATLSEKVEQYSTYEITLKDTLQSGSFDAISALNIKLDGAAVADTEDYTVTVTGADSATKDGFEVKFVFTAKENKTLASLNGKTITIDFTAKLGEGAVVGGAGNTNKLNVTYSNNPNTNDKGKTTESTVTVFTYKIVVDKVKEDEEPLEGAGFTLYKVSKTDAEAGVPTASATDAASKNAYWATKALATAGTWTPSVDGAEFTFKGLDDGYYILCETTTPNGYNTIDPQAFKVEATHTIDDGITSLTATALTGSTIEFTSDTEAGSLSTTVVNESGTELPETGGIGTTIFYILGALLVIGCGIVLIARRRLTAK